MKMLTQFGPLADVPADWLVVGVWEKEPLDARVRELDEKLGNPLSRLVEKGDVTGKAKELASLLDVRGAKAQRVLAVGLGQRNKADVISLTNAAAAAAKSITTRAFKRIAMNLPENYPGLDAAGVAWAVGIGLRQGSEGSGLRKTKPGRFAPKELALVAAPSERGAVEAGAKRADVEGRAVSLALRELVNLPPCDLYPETFADRAVEVARAAGVAIEVWDEPRLKQERMGSLLGVSQGSQKPPRLVLLQYRGGGSGPTLGLVGKGVTFDSGGLSLKPSDGMLTMKCDMAGAAAVLGAFQGIAELKLPINVLGVMALVENMPSGTAVKLGDVLHARNGKTIEVQNTDAEGRLILADALAIAVEKKASHLVDLATLTGACVVALGTEVAGVMSNDDGWSERVLSASRAAGERAWPLPMYPFYTELIKSDIADMRNTGGTRYGGAISAAKFLEEFVGDTPWVHLDIAGPAFAESDSPVREPGGTGAFVRTLIELARRYA